MFLQIVLSLFTVGTFLLHIAMLATHGVEAGALDAYITRNVVRVRSVVPRWDNGSHSLVKRVKGYHVILLTMLGDSTQTRFTFLTKFDTPLGLLVATCRLENFN